MFEFLLLPANPIHSPATLRGALGRLASFGERCADHVDARVPFEAIGPSPIGVMGSRAVLAILVESGMPLVPLSDCMGTADLFLRMPSDSTPYAEAWARLERLALETAPGAQPSASPHRL
jgi:hypothetical protein